MAKKQNNKLIYWGVAILGAIAGIVGLFLDIWNLVTTAGNASMSEGYKLFAEWPDSISTGYKLAFGKEFAPIWSTLFEILAIVALVAIVVAIILSLIKQDKLAKLIAVVAAVAVVALIICGCIFSIANHAEQSITAVDFKWAIGAWLIAIGSAIGATGCVLATRK